MDHERRNHVIAASGQQVEHGIKPLVLYATRGTRVWRDGMRQIPITRYAGPIPELR
jgi:hypothetical protein